MASVTYEECIEQAAVALGFGYEQKLKAGYGHYGDYTVLIAGQIRKGEEPRISVIFCASINNNPIPFYTYLEDDEYDYPDFPKRVRCSSNGFRVVLTTENTGTKEEVGEKLVQMVRQGAAILQDRDAENCDDQGVVAHTELYSLKGTFSFLSWEKADSYYKQFNRGVFTDRVKERYLPGVIGGVIGALIGVAAILALGRLQVLSLLGGIICGVTIAIGYHAGARKLSVRGGLICAGIALVFSYLAFRLDMGWTLYDSLGPSTSFIDCVIHSYTLSKGSEDGLIEYFRILVLRVMAAVGAAALITWVEVKTTRENKDFHLLGD